MSWVAAAAAAGLVIGMVSGHYVRDLRSPDTRFSSPADAGSEDTSVRTAAATVSDEEFLGRLELAVESTGGSTLQALHELTPLVWEVSAP